MTCPSKRKTIVKEQGRNSNKKFAKKSRVDNNNDWEDKNNSGWDEIELPNEDENKILDDVENEHNNQLNLKEKIESLRIKLNEKQKSLSVSEFNKK
ncbi:unnamed protein product [Rhizophagus irregularis]|nr:unnamed protein product [Rhizophagus irregularis]